MNTGGPSNTSSLLFFFPSFTNCFLPGSPPISCLDPWYIAAGVVILLSSMLGIPANITVIGKLIQHVCDSSMSQHLIFSLTLSDLFCLLILLVGNIVFCLGLHLNLSICQLLFFLLFFCNITNSNILVLISIQRYYQVLRPEKWIKVVRTWQRVLLFSVWLLGALLAIPAVFFLSEVKNKEKRIDEGSCKNLRVSPVLEWSYILFTVYSHVVLLSCYPLLARKVNRIQRSSKEKLRITKLVLHIMAVSLVFAFIALIFRTVYVTLSLTASEKLLYMSKVLIFMECFYFFKHTLNPLLYCFVGQHESTAKTLRIFIPLNDSS
ncbi:C-C chemokine receptor type 9-like [Archocentrus centrarchus]|uniref:C-C chemokine receptor type 9-like n=1 Tax=Archocentrus centrarchus TaxID=63155 RepID=UPI0011E9E4E7|nr:C-C chemokine receptor type 9-like [Archocentrus centrarchus]